MKKSICFLIISVLLVCSKAKAQLPDFIERLNGGTVQSGDFFEKIPFELNDGRVYVTSLVNGHKYRFLVDTHSPCLLYDYILDEVDLDTIDKSSTLGKMFLTGFLKPVFPKIDTFSIGKIKFSEIGAILMKDDSTNPLRDNNMDGILGSNLMKHCIWQFNFNDSTIILTNNVSKCTYTEGAIQLPFIPKPVQGSPNVFIMVGNDTINVEFDTGNNGFVNALSPGIFKKINEGKTIEWSMKLDIPVDRDDLDSIETHYYVMIDSMQTGNHTLYNLPIVAYNPEYKQTMGKGSMGIDFLKHFITTIDWYDNKIYLYPNEGKNQLPHNKRTFGFTYGYKKNKFVVTSIFSGSEAEQSGIKIGDELLAINGYRLTQLSKQSIKKYQSGELKLSSDNDDKIVVIILKDGVKKKFILSRYNLFDMHGESRSAGDKTRINIENQ
ncbi:MAG: hypothetical protein GXO83_01735 [Chlorobi bacterium]|nr:hypothetical protein [Chlorobiota bacterium]